MMSKLVLAVFAIVATLSQAFVPASNSWTGRVSNARIARAAPLQMSAEVEGKLKEIVAEQLGVEESSITSEANFAADLGADSLDVVEMVMKIEEAFNIELPDERAEEVQNLSDAVRVVTELME